MSNVLTFFTRERRTKSLRKDVQHRRAVLIAMLESGEPLSIPKISNKADVYRSVVGEMIEKFVKAGFVSPIVVAKYKAIQHSKYELTNGGKMIAFAVSVDEKRVLGDRTVVLQKIFQPERGTDTLTFFVRSVMLNAVNNGLQRYVLEFIRNIAEIIESSTEPNLWKIAQNGVSEARPSEVRALKKSVIQALYSLEDPDRDTVVQYYRNMTIQGLFFYGMQSHDGNLQLLAKDSQRDPDGIYIPFQCKKCGYEDKRWYIEMEEVIVEVFTGGLECPKCHRLIADSQTYRKGFRNPRIQLHVSQTH